MNFLRTVTYEIRAGNASQAQVVWDAQGPQCGSNIRAVAQSTIQPDVDPTDWRPAAMTNGRLDEPVLGIGGPGTLVLYPEPRPMRLEVSDSTGTARFVRLESAA